MALSKFARLFRRRASGTPVTSTAGPKATFVPDAAYVSRMMADEAANGGCSDVREFEDSILFEYQGRLMTGAELADALAEGEGTWSFDMLPSFASVVYEGLTKQADAGQFVNAPGFGGGGDKGEGGHYAYDRFLPALRADMEAVAMICRSALSGEPMWGLSGEEAVKYLGRGWHTSVGMDWEAAMKPPSGKSGHPVLHNKFWNMPPGGWIAWLPADRQQGNARVCAFMPRDWNAFYTMIQGWGYVLDENKQVVSGPSAASAQPAAPAPATRKCGKCSTENPEKAKRCMECGDTLGGTPHAGSLEDSNALASRINSKAAALSAAGYDLVQFSVFAAQCPACADEVLSKFE